MMERLMMSEQRMESQMMIQSVLKKKILNL
jgi:hypothetical protein